MSAAGSPTVPALTVPALLARHHDRGTADAVVTPDASITHGELERRSRALAERLLGDGVAKGTRFGLQAENGIEWVVVALAAMRIGAVLVPLSTLLSADELTAQLRVAEVEQLVVTRRFRGRELFALASSVAGEVPSLHEVRALDEVAGPVGAEPVGAEPVGAEPVGAEPVGGEPVGAGAGVADAVLAAERAVDPSDDVVVLFTSGSRGTPKGVLHTHGGATLAVRSGLEARRVGPDDRMYLPMPLFWTGGFSVGLFTMVVVGNALVTEASPEPSATLALLERERVTLFRGWPDQAARLAAHPDHDRYDLSSLRDASLPPLLPVERRPPVGARPSVLGMTETFGPYCGERLDRDLPPELWGCCGRPFPGVEVRVVDPDTGGSRAAGQRGELWLRGPSLLRGICGRAHDEVFVEDGWFRTGDLGHVDDGGHIWFAGRLDDMFKVSGASVYPSEVESALRSLPGVREAHVVDVPGPRGAAVGALVVSDRSREELRAGARELLSAFKVPSSWTITQDPASVPRMATGKIDTSGLRALLGTEDPPQRT